MKKTLFKIFDKFIEGVDTYYNNGSMWLIFTDEKKWVIELTKGGTLWYNFYFFKDCFKYLSLDVVENQHYITEWVEDTIQNGVRKTLLDEAFFNFSVEDVIQNGVRYVAAKGTARDFYTEEIIQNGVRSTTMLKYGIKEINHCSVSNDENAKNAIEFGIKETHEDAYHNKGRVEGVIRNGIKETKSLEHDRTTYLGYFSQERGSHTPLDTVQDVIKNGIKETIELPDKSGELNGYGEYYARQKNGTYPHTDIVNDVITDGIKETNWRKVDNHPTYLDHILIEK